jgi:hypothetical protein
MPARTSIRARPLRAGVTAALVLFGIALVPTGASAAAPTLSASLAPGSVSAGSTTGFSLTVSSNQGQLSTLTLGTSNNFIVDADSVVPSSGTPAGSSASQVSVSGLKISGSSVLTVSFDAAARCTPGSYGWTLTATQKTGTSYVPVTFSTTVTTTSECRLLFHTIHGGVKDVPFPVSVEVRRADGSVDDAYTGDVSMSIENDPGEDDAMLTGGDATPATAGVATFWASLNEAGTGYVLEACSPNVNGVATCSPMPEDGSGFLSNAFSIYDDAHECRSASDCFVTASGLQIASARVSATNGQAGDVISVGIWSVAEFGGAVSTAALTSPGTLDCAGYDEVTTEVTSFDYTGDGTKVVTDTLSTDVMQALPSNGVAHLQTCFGSESSFPTRPATPPAEYDPVLGLWVGLLPDCPSNRDFNLFAPCVISRMSSPMGEGMISYVAEEGDPAGRH